MAIISPPQDFPKQAAAAEDLFSQGLAQHRASRHRAAADLFRQASDLNPYIAKYHSYLGCTYRARGQYSEALSHYNRALELTPGYVMAKRYRGITFELMGKPNDAVSDLMSSIESDPENATVLLKIARIRRRQLKLDEALSIITQCRSLNPRNAEIACEAGHILKQCGRAEEARLAFREARQLDPDYVGGAVYLPEFSARENGSDQLITWLSGGQPFMPKALNALLPGARHCFLACAVYLKRGEGRPLRILEVGSWMGASAMIWGEALTNFSLEFGTLLCLDSWAPWGDASIASLSGGMFAHEDSLYNETIYRIFRHNIGTIDPRVRVMDLRGPSAESMQFLEKESFDIIYIDAAHWHAAVLGDIRAAHPLLKIGGIMCGDDLDTPYPSEGVASPIPAETFERYRFSTANHEADPETGLNFTPGVALAVHDFFGDVSQYYGTWMMRKTETGYEKIAPSEFRDIPIEKAIPRLTPYENRTRIAEQFRDVVFAE